MVVAESDEYEDGEREREGLLWEDLLGLRSSSFFARISSAMPFLLQDQPEDACLDWVVVYGPSKHVNRYFRVQFGFEIWVQQLLGSRWARLVGSLLGGHGAFIAVVAWEESAGATGKSWGIPISFQALLAKRCWRSL